MGNTLSMSHRGYFCRALYLHYFDNKLVQDISVVLSGFFCRASYLPRSDDKSGTLIWRRGALIWARVPNDLRDPRVLRDTKASARNIKGFSPLSFIVIRCYLSFCAFPLLAHDISQSSSQFSHFFM